jgi:hypothetical protein
MANDTNTITPDGARGDEQPIEHVRSLAPEEPADPGKPTEEDDGPVPTPAGPIL